MHTTPALVNDVYSKSNWPTSGGERKEIYKKLSWITHGKCCYFFVVWSLEKSIWYFMDHNWNEKKLSIDPGLIDFKVCLHVSGYLRAFMGWNSI